MSIETIEFLSCRIQMLRYNLNDDIDASFGGSESIPEIQSF